MPYMTEKYYYVGDDCVYFTSGEQYQVIETGKYFQKPYEDGVWMTCDDYPETKDPDYGVFCPLKMFYKEFVKY